MGDAPPPQTIAQVLAKMDEIISWSLQSQSRAGYFAALYRRVTQTVRSQIGTGFFDDDDRMELLDVTFACRYLTAFDQWRRDDPQISLCWEVAFEATENEQLIILQNLLVGMNAHINYDLGIAAAQIAPTRPQLESLHADFNRINCLLACLVPTVFEEIGTLSPLIHLLEDVDEMGEEKLVGVVMDVARDFAWILSNELVALGDAGESQATLLHLKDREVGWLGQKVVEPGELIEEVLDIVRAPECKDISTNIGALGSCQTLPQSCLTNCKSESAGTSREN